MGGVGVRGRSMERVGMWLGQVSKSQFTSSFRVQKRRPLRSEATPQIAIGSGPSQSAAPATKFEDHKVLRLLRICT